MGKDVFAKSEDEPSDENRGITLQKARNNYTEFGAFSKDFLNE